MQVIDVEIKLTEHAGFCFGVNKAVKIAFELNHDGPVYTIGELIHNRQILDELERRDIKKLDRMESLKKGDCVIIRAHGIGKGLYQELCDREVKILDATCPYVKRIHDIVKTQQEQGFQIIIVGDPNHPEVIGINGWCEGKALIIASEKVCNRIKI